jgi:hypothetical protein
MVRPDISVQADDFATPVYGVDSLYGQQDSIECHDVEDGEVVFRSAVSGC